MLAPAWSAVKDAEPVRPTPDTSIVNVPLLGADNAAQVESPRKNVVLLAVPEAKRAVGTVPELITEAFKLVRNEPPAMMLVAVTLLAVKLPEASRATIVEAPFAEAAVVYMLAIVPVLITLAFIAVTDKLTAALPSNETLAAVAPPEIWKLRAVVNEAAEPEILPVTLAVIVFAEKLPLASRATIVEAPLEAEAVVLALFNVPDVILSALVVSVVAEAAKPVISEAAGWSQDGTPAVVPLPVWFKNFLVVVVLPANLAKVLAAEL